MARDEEIPVDREGIRSFFHDLEFRMRTVGDLNLYLANQFNVFRSFEPDELTLSRIISDFLNPAGSHGQGGVFLRGFLDMLHLPNITIDERRVVSKCEERTRSADNPQRSIDIFVNLDGQFALGIENKPWAGDQPGWVKDYSDHLSRKFGEDRFKLVFLTREGRKPESPVDQAKADELKQEGKLQTICYEIEFADWLRSCGSDVQAYRIREFLKDFVSYAEAMEVYSMASEAERKLVADYLYESPGKLRIAGTVAPALREVGRRIVLEFLIALKQRLEERLGATWRVDKPSDQIFGLYGTFGIQKLGWPPKYFVVIEAERTEAINFVIGVTKDPEVPVVSGGQMGEELDKQYGLGRRHKNWEWYQYLRADYRDLNSPDTLERLLCNRGEALDYFVDYFMKLAEVAARFIDAPSPPH